MTFLRRSPRHNASLSQPITPPAPKTSPAPPRRSAKTAKGRSGKLLKFRHRTKAIKHLEDQCSPLRKESVELAYGTARVLCMSALEECRHGLTLKETQENKKVKEKLHAMIKGLGHILEEETEVEETESRLSKKRKLSDEAERDPKRLRIDDESENDSDSERRNAVAERNMIVFAHMLAQSPSSGNKQHSRTLRKRDSPSTNQELSENNFLGVGLRNDTGQNHCFLNVIIQSLWHLKVFRDKFMSKFESDPRHLKIGTSSNYCESTSASPRRLSRKDPCPICALRLTFTDLDEVYSRKEKRAVDATLLRNTLSKLKPGGTLFKEGVMGDASEVLDAILNCIHTSFRSPSRLLACKGDDNVEGCSLNCEGNNCLVHEVFAMRIQHSKHPQRLHHANVSCLKEAKGKAKDNSFDKLLKLVNSNEGLFQEPDNEDGEEKNQVGYLRSSAPHVFTVVIGWTDVTENRNLVVDILNILEHEIDIGNIYDDLTPGKRHRLRIMICYIGLHYVCFVYDKGHEKWTLYNDAIVEEAGIWEEVLRTCQNRLYQPSLLLYEAVDDNDKDPKT